MSSDAPVDTCRVPARIRAKFIPCSPLGWLRFASAALHPERATIQLYFSAPEKRHLALCGEAHEFKSAWQVWGRRGHDRRAAADLAAGQLFCSAAAHEHGHLTPKLRVEHQRPVLRIGRDICESAIRHRTLYTCNPILALRLSAYWSSRQQPSECAPLMRNGSPRYPHDREITHPRAPPVRGMMDSFSTGADAGMRI
jgi:hypothetical protein